MREYRRAFVLVFLLAARCDGCCCSDNCKSPETPDAGLDVSSDRFEGGAAGECFKGSCGNPGEPTCDQIAATYCLPLLMKQNDGRTPTTCDLSACASSTNDGLNPHPDTGPLSGADRQRAANYLTECMAMAGDASVSQLLECPKTAAAKLANAPEKGPVAPWGALTIPGDRASRVRCAYTACRSVAGPCFGDDFDGGGFAVAAGAADSCLGYRLCLAGCRQNISDSVRRSRCVLEQCDPKYPSGLAQFRAYRDCMLEQPASCGDWLKSDAGADGS
jgi:hypothetical protein